MLRQPLTASFAVATCALAATINVPADYAQIQAAIDAANDGDIVLVQPGTFVETLNFLGKGITVTGTAPEDPAVVARTVVDADGQGSVVTFASGETRTSVLAGLKITGGTGTDQGCYEPGSTCGGGIFVRGVASPAISKCIITNNSTYGTEGRGGGLYGGDSSFPTIASCEVSHNTGSAFGGGICLDENSTAVLRHSRIRRNETLMAGGGGIHARNSQVALIGCEVTNNSSGRAGGGITLEQSIVRIENVLVAENDAQLHGGGINFSTKHGTTTVLSNCVLLRNSAGTDGGGIYYAGPASFTVTHCTIRENSVQDHGAAIYIADRIDTSLSNSVLWMNTPDEIRKNSGDLEISYCNITNGYPGVGNIHADPIFRSFRGFECLLAPHSPSVDAGDPAIEDRISDWHPRWPDWYPNGPRSDMGAYGGPGNVGWLR